MLRTQAHPEVIQAWIGLLRAHGATTRGLRARLCEHGLSINDYEALLALADAEDGRMRRVDLAEELELTPSGVTRMLEGLEANGLVERHVCKSDLRVAYAVITDEGRERLAAASCAHLAALREIFEQRFDEQELAALTELLQRVR